MDQLIEMQLECCESTISVYVDQESAKDLKGFIWRHSAIGHVVEVAGHEEGPDDAGQDRA